MKDKLNRVLRQFFPSGQAATFTKIDCGHIHVTYLVEAREKFILQQINHHVFRDIPLLMENISRVCLHLQQAGDDYPLQLPCLINTVHGNSWYLDEDNNSWRLFSYITDSKAFPKPPSLTITEAGGMALGHFTKALSDMEPGKLQVVLPRFHDVTWRWEQYLEAKDKAEPERFRETKSELHTAEKFYPLMLNYSSLLKADAIPVRVTHNDTKFNNILFNSKDEAISIIDLDTVMPGYSLYDFGDAIRTVANSREEDERDSCQVRFDLPHFNAFTKGFLSITKQVLTQQEIKHLAYSSLYITYIQGLRFLTDHLNGDTYYPTRYFGHNLIRASVQFTLLKQMEEKIPRMEEIISSCLD